MKLSDLLEAARDEAPAARYTVDDVVAAGRRRRNRNRSVWALAAVVAVAVAIGVPQIVARHPDPPTLPVAPTQPTRPLDRIFKGFKVGAFEVGDPEWVGINNQSTYITRPRAGYKTPWFAGTLNVYRTGFEPRQAWMTGTADPTEAIEDRPAFFAQPRPGYDRDRPDQVLAWHYAQDAVAVITSYDGRLSRAEMRRLASSFRTTLKQPVRQIYSAGWLPPGLKLVAVHHEPLDTGSALFAPEAAAPDYEVFAHGVHASNIQAVTYTLKQGGWFNPLATLPPGGLAIDGLWSDPINAGYRDGEGPACEKRTPIDAANVGTDQCYIQGDNYETSVTVRAGEAVPVDDLRKVAASIRFAGPREANSSWVPATESFPTSAQLPRD